MKFAWCRNVTDLTARNSSQHKEVDLNEYHEMLVAEEVDTESECPEVELICEDWD
jgi:hypothetical protein